MKRKILIVITVALALFGLFSIFEKASTFMAIDDCLDRSGAWDYQHGKCEGAREK